jgi:hypothetical protein
MSPERSRAVVPACVAPIVITLAASSAMAQSADGSGSFFFAMPQTQFWTKTDSASQQARLGLITHPMFRQISPNMIK